MSTRISGFVATISWLGCTVMLAGCASTASPVRVLKADDVDPGKCQTFAWHAPSDQAASFTDQRVRSQVMTTLKAKGYSEVAEKADCLVSYVFSTRALPRSKPGVGVGVGGGSGGVGGGIGVTLPIGRKNTEAGTFTLDVIDAAKKAQIWSGSIEGTFKAAELTDEEAKDVVERVLAEFPDRSMSN
jgi:hypothetical protein